MKFDEPFLHLNDKLAIIDGLIAQGSFDEAKKIINEVLQEAPGIRLELPDGGEVPNSGELYWKKLLAEVGCKNNDELLVMGKPLDQYPAFYNAINYASETEKSNYLSIEENKKSIRETLLKTLKKQELDEKLGKQPDKSLSDLQAELDTLKALTGKKLFQLEETEKEINERAIDYEAAIGEYKHSLECILTEVKNVRNKNSDNISMEERDQWIDELERLLLHGRHEADSSKNVKADSQHYLQWSKLRQKQENIVSEIISSVSQIKALNGKIEGVLAGLNNIAGNYAEAESALVHGDYDLAKTLLTPERFNGVVKQSLEEVENMSNTKGSSL